MQHQITTTSLRTALLGVMAIAITLGAPSAHATDANTCATLRQMEEQRVAREQTSGIPTTPIPIPNDCVNPQPTQAANPTAPANAAQASGDFDAVCGQFLVDQSKLPPGTTLDDTVRQKSEYCRAAHAAKKAASGSKMTGAVYVGVAGICTAECVSSFGMGNMLCNGSSIGAAVTDAVVTKNFTSAITGIIGAAGPAMIMGKGVGGLKGMFKSHGSGAVEGTKVGKNWAACFTAGMAAFQAIMKFKSSSSSKKSYEENFELARQLNTTTQTKQLADSQNFVAPGGGTTGGGGGSTTSYGSQAAFGDGTTQASSPTCDSASIQCALATDAGLPSAVGSPEFAGALKESTGLSLADLFNLPADGSSVAKVMSAPLGGGQATGEQLRTTIAAIEKKPTDVTVPGGEYAAGGSGAGSGGGGSDPDPAALIAQLTQAVTGGSGAEGGPGARNGRLDYAKLERRPASAGAEEDPRRSLFERVAIQYAKRQTRMSAPANDKGTGLGANF